MKDHKSVLEAQFESLKSVTAGGAKGVFDWLEKIGGDFSVAKAELKRRRFGALATDEGIAFIKGQYPCPNAIRREH